MSSVLLVGGGRMGGALLAGWRKARPGDSVFVVEPNADLRTGLSVPSGEAAPVDFSPDVVVLAVKPQVMGDVAPAYGRHAGPACVYLSIAAGLTLDGLGRMIGPGARVVRAMPNTPAAIGRGVSALIAGRQVDDAQRALCAELMAAAGAVEWLESEAQMDALTAVSGCGPAYVFYMVEAMAAAGAAAGLPADLAARVARATVSGAGALMEAEAETDPADLRRAVTSPNGVTAEGLRVLMDEGEGLPPLMRRVIDAAAARSAELASG